MADDDDDEDELNGFDVPERVHTVCHLCGGAGMIASPVLGIVGSMARTIDNGRNCPACDGDGHFVGIVPPV
jgi:hypothetical protein